MTAPRISLGSSARQVKLWTYGGIGGCTLLALIAWFAFISPAMSDVSSVKSQTSEAQTQNDVLRAKIAHLQQVDAGIADLRTQVTQVRAALPVTDGLPDFTRQLQTQAGIARVALTSITAGAPTQVGAGAVGSTPTTPAAGVSAAGKLYSIPVTLVTNGDLPGQLAMLKEIQTVGPRRALVTSTQFSPGSTAITTSIDKSVTMTVQMQIFVAPQTPQAEAQLKKQLGSQATS
jgi:hypothetical protein